MSSAATRLLAPRSSARAASQWLVRRGKRRAFGNLLVLACRLEISNLSHNGNWFSIQPGLVVYQTRRRPWIKTMALPAGK